ncbi:APC family permease [Streptomyces asiaticus]
MGILSGSVGILFMFAVAAFGGFEATAIFRDEVREPKKTVSRATYACVAVTTLLYAFTAWLFIEAYGTGKVVGAAAADPAGSMESSILAYAGHTAADVTLVLVNTSVFAAMLAAHNITSRYVYNLSADGILPRILGKAHVRYGSPYRASLATSAIVFAGLLLCVLTGASPSSVYPILFGVFGYSFVVLLVGTSIAVPVYMYRKHRGAATYWTAAIAPALAFIGLGIGLVPSTKNLPLLIDASSAQGYVVLGLVYGVFATGVVMALIYRKKRPQVYARIGRQN